jgi:hypothetical protein
MYEFLILDDVIEDMNSDMEIGIPAKKAGRQI